MLTARQLAGDPAATLHVRESVERIIIANRPLDASGMLLPEAPVPAVSFIVLSYNNAAYLASTLESVSSQTFSDLEIVIADDGSTDASQQIVREFVGRCAVPAVALLHRRNGGIAANYNSCLQRVRGRHVAHIGSDDRNHPARVERQLAALHASGASMCITAMEVIDAKSRHVRWVHPRTELQSLQQVLDSGTVSVTSPTMCFARELIDRFGLLPAELANEDEALAFRALALSGIHVLPEYLVQYRVHPASVTSRNRVFNLGRYVEWRRGNLPFQLANKRHWLEVLDRTGKDAAAVERTRGHIVRLESELAFLSSLPARSAWGSALVILFSPTGRRVLRNYATQVLRSSRTMLLLSWVAIRTQASTPR